MVMFQTILSRYVMWWAVYRHDLFDRYGRIPIMKVVPSAQCRPVIASYGLYADTGCGHHLWHPVFMLLCLPWLERWRMGTDF